MKKTNSKGGESKIKRDLSKEALKAIEELRKDTEVTVERMLVRNLETGETYKAEMLTKGKDHYLLPINK